MRLRGGFCRTEKVLETDSAVELTANQVAHSVDRLSSVVGGVDVDSEGAAALRHVDNTSDGSGHLARIGIGWRQISQLLGHLVHEAGVEGLVLIRDFCLRGVAAPNHVSVAWDSSRRSPLISEFVSIAMSELLDRPGGDNQV
jgi:hypothetical protein